MGIREKSEGTEMTSEVTETIDGTMDGEAEDQQLFDQIKQFRKAIIERNDRFGWVMLIKRDGTHDIHFISSGSIDAQIEQMPQVRSYEDLGHTLRTKTASVTALYADLIVFMNDLIAYDELGGMIFVNKSEYQQGGFDIGFIPCSKVGQYLEWVAKQFANTDLGNFQVRKEKQHGR